MKKSLLADTVPMFRRQLGAMLSWIDKADEHAKQRNFSPDAFLALRLAPDMLPFVEQVHHATQVSLTCVARLRSLPLPPPAENSSTLIECKQHLTTTLEYLDGLADNVLHSEDPVTVSIGAPGGGNKMATEEYVRHRILPNFFFHATVAYALLRQAGVQLGKADYLGA